MINITPARIVTTMLLASLVTFSASVFNHENCSTIAYADSQFTPVQGKVIYVPSGTVFPATATMELSSESLQLGQSVCIALSQDFYYNNTLIAPIGSSVNGTVIRVKKAGKSGENGLLSVKFTNIITPYGQMIPMSGKIKTDDGSGIIKGTKKAATNTQDVAIASAAGAAAGTMAGSNPPAQKSPAKAAAYGAAVGSGVAMSNSILDKGNAALIPAGAVVNIVLDQQITFTPQKR